jgi:hypothetical protein
VTWRAVFLVIVLGCAASGSDRASETAARRRAHDSLLTTEVVQSLKTPASVGRLIYDRPTDLSYDSLRLKRPDLVRAADRR